jgi:hypothetical protein
MKTFCILVSTTVLSSIGWYLGKPLGLSAAFLLSFGGSVGGVFLGWRVHRDYLI